MHTQLIRYGSERRLVYHWYEGSLGWTAELLRAFLALDRSPWRRPGEILTVRLSAQVHGPAARGRAAAEQHLESFYRRIRPILDELSEDIARKRFSSFSS